MDKFDLCTEDVIWKQYVKIRSWGSFIVKVDFILYYIHDRSLIFDGDTDSLLIYILSTFCFYLSKGIYENTIWDNERERMDLMFLSQPSKFNIYESCDCIDRVLTAQLGTSEIKFSPDASKGIVLNTKYQNEIEFQYEWGWYTKPSLKFTWILSWEWWSCTVSGSSTISAQNLVKWSWLQLDEVRNAEFLHECHEFSSVYGCQAFRSAII